MTGTKDKALESARRKIRRLNRTVEPPASGTERQWVRCLACGWVGYYDYVAYGLSRPILTMGCGCFPFDEVAERVPYKPRK